VVAAGSRHGDLPPKRWVVGAVCSFCRNSGTAAGADCRDPDLTLRAVQAESVCTEVKVGYGRECPWPLDELLAEDR